MKTTFKGSKKEKKKKNENPYIKKQPEGTSGQKAQQTNSEKKQQNVVFLQNFKKKPVR